MRDVLLRSSDFYGRARGKISRERSGDANMWETSEFFFFHDVLLRRVDANAV